MRMFFTVLYLEVCSNVFGLEVSSRKKKMGAGGTRDLQKVGIILKCNIFGKNL